METYPGPIEPTHKDIIITAGGTREQIDDVRYVGNFSGGRFGHALAQEFQDYGRSVLLLCPNETIERLGPIDGVAHMPFTDSASLNDSITRINSANIFLQAAAISDYSPIRIEGKISSDQEALTVRLKRNPKILATLRQHFGNSAFIVGFKLLSGAGVDDLLTAGRQQISTNDTDMCIANDLSRIGSRRTIYALDGTEDRVTRVQGNTNIVARHVASMILLGAEQKRGQR